MLHHVALVLGAVIALLAEPDRHVSVHVLQDKNVSSHLNVLTMS